MNHRGLRELRGNKRQIDLIPDNDPINILSGQVVSASMEVHTQLGPGLLESAYELCLTSELTTRGLKVERQVAVPVRYKGVELEAGYRIDLLVEKKLVVEVKAVELLPIHEAQLMTYLKLMNLRLGLLLNFNKKRMRDGIQRVIL